MLVPDEAVDLHAAGDGPSGGPGAAAAAPVPPRSPAPPPKAAVPRAGEFLAGDGIRGVAMLCVLGAHLSGGALVIDRVYDRGYRPGYGLIPGIALVGLQLALPMFFVLSAYLISRPYVRAYVLGRPTPSLVRYLRNRALRIVPVFWLLGGLMLVLYGTQGSSLRQLAALFGFAQIYDPSGASKFIGQAWTIDVEVAFYLIVPLSAYLITVATRRHAALRGGRGLSPRARIGLILGLLAAATLASAWLRAKTVGSLWTESPPATFYYFAPGVALAALELELAGPLGRGRLPAVPVVFAVIAALITAALATAVSTDPLALLRVSGALGISLATGLAFAALLARQHARGDSPRWVDNQGTRWLGARSYPCYIIQSATIFEAARLVGRVGGPWTELLALSALGLPLTLAAGAIIHATVERPVLAWGRGRTHRAVVARNA